MRVSLVLLLGFVAILGGRFSTTAAQQTSGPAFPSGCGPRQTVQPPSSVIPTSSMPLGRALPIYGGPMGDSGVAASGGTVVVSTGPEWAEANTLYMSINDGRSWIPLSAPPGIENSLSPIALSADGRRLAGADLHHLFVVPRFIPQGQPPTWVAHPVQNLFALAFDSADSNQLIGLGGDIGPQASASIVYLSNDGGTTLRVLSQLPLPLGHGQALVVVRSTAIVALGQAAGRVHVFAVPLVRGTTSELPHPPGSVAYSLSAEPGGTLYLITESGLFALPPGAAGWHERLLPPGATSPKDLYLAATSQQLYLVSDADGLGMMWRADAKGGDWQSVVVPIHGGYIGRPASGGRHVWVLTAEGPVLVGPDGNAEVRTTGITAPVSIVASAPWRPTRVAAAWSGVLVFSDDGGQTWANRSPPIYSIRGPSEMPSGISEIAWTADGGCISVIVPYLALRVGAAYYEAHPQTFLSDDQGRTWWRLPGPDGGSIVALTESPVGSGIRWAGPYRSIPGRAVWTRVDLPPEAEGSEAVWRFGTLNHLAPAPDGIWLGGDFGIWHLRVPSTPEPTITHVWGAGNSYVGLVSNPYNPSVVYSGVRRTVDGGRTWDLPLPGPTDVHPGTGYSWWAFAPDHPGAVIDFDNTLVRDDGRSWVPFWSPPDQNQRIAALAPAGPGRFYVAVMKLGLVVVEDSTTRWHMPSTPPYLGRWIPPPREPGPAALLTATVEATAPSDPRTIYELTYDGRLDVSYDGGRSFSALPPVALANGPCCWIGAGPHILAKVLAISPADPKRLYVGITLDGAAGYQPDLGLWISDDSGTSWRRSGLPLQFSVDGIAIVPGSPTTLYAVAGPQLMRSMNGGESWSPVKIAPDEVYSVATPTATEVLVGGEDEVWRSGDGGQTFTRMYLGIPTWGEPGSRTPGNPIVAILQTPTGELFVGSRLGVARSRDGGRTWQIVSEPVGDPPVLPEGLDLRGDGSLAVATQYGTFIYRPVR